MIRLASKELIYMYIDIDIHVHLDCYPARINVGYSSKAKTGVLLSMLIYYYLLLIKQSDFLPWYCLKLR